mmetsp:Transcript_103157/g.204935  ORF Transcript_103157/g.204935 Transcript_103157/m.204935 type:complete len:232 (+) Transcript_103157:107-802(+)
MTHASAHACECGTQVFQDPSVQAGASDAAKVDHTLGHASPCGSPLANSDAPCQLRNSDPASDKVSCSSAWPSKSPTPDDALPLDHLQGVDLDMAKAFFERHAMWSSGSEAHLSSHCIPCRYFHTKLGCKHGQSCIYCHMPHAHQASAHCNRASKAKRLHCRRILGLLADEFASTSDHKQAFPVLQFAASQSSYLQTSLRQWLMSTDSVSEVPSSMDEKGDLSSTKGLLVML